MKEPALYVQDTITKGNWRFNLGIRGDLYNGLAIAHQAEPRLGVAYNIKQSNTVLRVSYARTLETPFNENLVLSSVGCAIDVLIRSSCCCTPGASTVLAARLPQRIPRGIAAGVREYVVFDGEYIWKYTHNGFDFSVLGNTPITFPIEWHNSNIPGFAARVTSRTSTDLRLTWSCRASPRVFFTPQIGGAGAVPPTPGTESRLPHRPR